MFIHKYVLQLDLFRQKLKQCTKTKDTRNLHALFTCLIREMLIDGVRKFRGRISLLTCFHETQSYANF